MPATQPTARVIMAAPRSWEVAESPGTIPERSLGGLLNETFLVYGRNLWLIIGIVAVVNVPALVLAFILGNGPAGYVVEVARGTFGLVYVYGAVVFAVGQQYLGGNIDIGRCYYRVWSLVISLTLFMFAIFVGTVLFGTMVYLLAFTLILPVILLVLALTIIVYLWVAVPALVTEGCSWVDAARRSFRLVQESWWRVCAITLVVVLVTTGLAIVAMVPFMVGDALAGLGGLDTLGRAVKGVGGIVVAVVALPVPAIAGTLLYYDLRVRKEGFDMPSLSREMGFATV